MALQERHRWMATNAAASFGVDESVILNYVGEINNLKKINDFLDGRSKHRHIFIYYQRPDAQNELGELVDQKGDPKVMITTGEHEDMRIKSRAVFFVRVNDSMTDHAEKKAIKQDVPSDGDLLFGEMSANPLESLNTGLLDVFQPLLSLQSSIDVESAVSNCDTEQAVNFRSDFSRFTTDLSEGVRSLTSGIELESPEPVAVDLTNPDVVSSNPQLIEKYEALLDNWCQMIEQYLEETTENQQKDTGEPGPRTELDYWRSRLQKITSVTEQLRTKERKQVFNLLQSVSKLTTDTRLQSQQSVFKTLRRWKEVDIGITEAFNEAKDNVKYLTSLEKFIEPLYESTPAQIIETLPALMNAAQMILTISRYYNTTERMTKLFTKITNQMITTCKLCILEGEEVDALWMKDRLTLIHNLDSCIKLNEAYQAQYKITKETLQKLPKGKQFDFSETLIFGRFDLFCRRVFKLMDMFQTIHQFTCLSQHRFDGMEPLVESFKKILMAFQTKRHDLLDFQQNKFDRDYVDFNVKISDLENNLRQFINQSFESISSIEASLKLLNKLQSILQRENLRADLESKFAVIFHHYGHELNQVQDQYEKCKTAPPIVRNLPPVAGHITWSRHLYKRIEGPMHKFKCNPAILASKDAKKLIRMYNKMAKTLIEFETLWLQAWINSIDAVKSGLQATLLIRHPDDGNRFHVNFDPEILMLIREARCMNRMGDIKMPEAARMVLLQEQKFKVYHSELSFFLREHRRVTQMIKPIVSNMLRSHIEHLEYKMRPGMVTLTWTSMNVESFFVDIWTELDKLEQLVLTVNDIMENRIDANLKEVASVLLVNLPDDQVLVSLDEFVEMQERHVESTTNFLVAKSLEIEGAVNDMLGIMVAFDFDPHVQGVTESEIIKVKSHYNVAMYNALLNATKRSLRAMKLRLSSNYRDGSVQPPAFFEVDVQLYGTEVCMVPSVEDIQAAINGGAVAVLKCSKKVEAWDTLTIPKNVQLILNPNLPPVQGTGSQGTFYDRIAADKEILKVLLLLTGSVQSTKNQVESYLQEFSVYKWCWNDNIAKKYLEFKASEPTLDDFEAKLKYFVTLEKKVEQWVPQHQISALMLSTSSLQGSLRELFTRWKEEYAKELHKDAYAKLEEVFEMVKTTRKRLLREVTSGDIDALAFVMKTLQEVRQRESEIELEFIPIEHMYRILDENLPNIMGKDEQDLRSMYKRNWEDLLSECEEKQKSLALYQIQYRKDLIKTVTMFKKDVASFRATYEKNGPMVRGIPPREAVERLKRFREEYEVRGRKQEIYYVGEDLFGVPHQQYPALDQTKQELGYLGTLYDLYVAVLETIKEYKDYLWVDVPEHMETMQKTIDSFAGRCKKMPKQLRDWPAYGELKKEIEDFQEVLPLLQELGKPSIMPRHWQQVMEMTGKELAVDGDEFKLSGLIEAKLNEFTDEISDICEGADKQLVIEQKIKEISAQWEGLFFDFGGWKQRDYPCILVGAKVGETQEILEETMNQLNTMNAQRHSIPFKEELTTLISTLSDTGDTIERWFKIQQMWTSLESVFMGGDIAKQMPQEAKRFGQTDKNWTKIMAKSAETKFVVPCCQNDMLKTMLPEIGKDLELCQKSLESYLEGKRNKFPRFYFTSDPVLLKILSQGSDPDSIQEDFEKLFDAINRVQFDKVDKKKIVKILGVVGTAVESVDLSTPVMAVGNIEDWLLVLEYEMQRSVRKECRNAALICPQILGGMTLGEFGNQTIAQVSLLGIQLVWTHEFQDALTRMAQKDKQCMAAANRKFVTMLSSLVELCLTDLGSKMNRTKFETLVTVHVHQKDLFQDVWKMAKQGLVKDQNDFEWLKQTRCYWKTDQDHAVVSIADVDFIYSYEYLGCKERLVITALTDRCYLTQSQALGMFFGGAPAGPAGTGKTETTKDMGRTLGIFVVVTNCSDQHRFRDMAKIFKGLCMSGLWGCFDEFNRIELEVLSVVAMQVESICTAKRMALKTFMFPGEAAPIKLVPAVGYFITMNPGYAGRQELPENLKVLFRSVAMMVPNRETIMKVKLASVGYSQMDLLGKKFCILYALCEQQLSKQRHYDFGLRNILSVLRTSGTVKRSEPPDADEEMLFMRTVRDMNLSKLVADDVPLFLALLKDIFPKVTNPPKKVYKNIEDGTRKLIAQYKIVDWDSWFLKVIQLYETSLVRHGFMLVGPTLCGKTEIAQILTECMTNDGNPHQRVIMNPKAITDSQMYGVKDPISEEWTPGVFASIWQKWNNRNIKKTTWIICDGPVDAIWIENLNTVLDDNKILTLANNDRIPMTDNCKIVFEVQDLRNASPATVSRAGIIYVSASDLGWEPLVQSWLLRRPDINPNRQAESDILKPLFDKWLKQPPPNAGAAMDFFDWNMRNIRKVMECNDSIVISNVLNILAASLKGAVDSNEILSEDAYRRVLCYSIMWGFGGLLEPEERIKLWNKFQEILEVNKHKDAIPNCKEEQTVFDYVPDWTDKARPWKLWTPEEWKPPKRLQFAQLLIPTSDSVRAEHLMNIISAHDITRTPPSFKSTMLVGAPGTAKTSTALMYTSKFDPDVMLFKRLNLSSATTPEGFQKTVEAEIEKKQGKTYCPPGGKQMTVFIDDASMPVVNKWGDQVTNELSRQLMEMSGFYFLDKDKRGDFKTIEGLLYVGAMGHPGGGKNDIPNRLKSKFLCFNMVLPSTTSVEAIFGSIMKVKFTAKGTKAPPAVIALSQKLCPATVDVWDKVKRSLLPTPLRFHYIFNMRDLSRVFQGIMECPVDIVKDEATLVGLWKHENVRVFADKLCRDVDKQFVDKVLAEFMPQHFGEELFEANKITPWYADFQEDEEFDDDTGESIGAPKIYKPAESWDFVKEKAYEYLKKYNEANPAKAMNLVLFDEAMMHLMKINRTIQQKRGSAMLVGVGGSGKQSLARLAGYMSAHFVFQITITKTYNDNALFDDLRNLFTKAGAKNENVTFIFTDAEVKSEGFLEYVNSFLATGDIVGLFAKDQKDGMAGDTRNDFVKDCPHLEENLLNMYNYFMDRLRDNLHVCLCFSPVNAKFPIRAQNFPAVFAVNINWFMPWPEAALVAVSGAFLGSYKLDCSDDERSKLYGLTGAFQATVRDMTDTYYQRMRKHVYVTPKSFLCLIDFYKQLYAIKYEEINVQERSVNVGLQKLKEASEQVEKLKIVIKEKAAVMAVEEKKTNVMLDKVTVEKGKADAKAEMVNAQKADCMAEADKIGREKAEAQVELDKAMPFLRDAEAACNSITKKDIGDLKVNRKPANIIRYVFDGLQLLMQKKVVEVKAVNVEIAKKEVLFIQDSFDEYSSSELAQMSFLPDLFKFAANDKDAINDETVELLEPYLRYNEDPAKHWGPWEHKVCEPSIAGKASGAAEGLCKFVGAMVQYQGAAKIVQPKLAALKLAEAQLSKAMAQLAAAEGELNKVLAEVAELDAELAKAQRTMKELQDSAAALQEKADGANKLLSGLSGENARWTEDSKNFALRRKKLVGDVGCVCAFVVYCGPFNSEFRDRLYEDFLADTQKRQVPGHPKVEQVSFLVDKGTMGEWALQGLPSDELSIQNAIMVTRSSRYPLMVDPQGQANRWIKKKEQARIQQNPSMCMTTLSARNLKDQVEFTMGEGLCLLIENVENEVDPMLDPVLDKQIIRKGKNLYINVSDQNMDYKEKFSLYMTSRLPNPHFSPELSAKTTVIDFTVTMKGLEQQLLGRLISMEQKSLEETLAALEEDVTNNTKALQLLDKQLLDRLVNSQGDLTEDKELMEVLANTKAKSKEVAGKLAEADERKIEINEKREQFRPVATRGSIMYFNMVDMTNVVNPITAQPSGWMYNCSLLQFQEQFDFSIRNSERAQPASKRVEKIIHFLTYRVYRYMNRGLFERDKMMFKLMVTMKIMIIAGQLTSADQAVFLKAGSSLDVKAERSNPFKWLSDKIWLNILQLSRHPFGSDQMLFYREIVDQMQRNEANWKKWYDENEPESCPVPDYEDRLVMDKTLGPFLRLCVVRFMREDRTGVACSQFIESMLDARFSAPVTDAITDIYEESTARKPVLYLLTAGSDPTFSIDELAKKKKKFPTDKVSMGEGQEKVARDKNNAAFLNGGWVILQNSHLGIGYMNELEDVILKTPEIEETYRLWITCEITPRFPIGLLQICIKVTLEPPAGLKAGIARTYSTMVSQELLDKIDHERWRTLVFTQSFLHSIVQERRKFGPIGWCVPYEYNNSDLDACLQFLEKHVVATILVGVPVSWVTVQYMVAEAQYGGRITDDLDRELFGTYTAKWFKDEIFKPSFSFNDYASDYNYKIPEGFEITQFRDAIDTLPPVDSPLIFGLHTNADLTYRLKEASEMIATIIETQPKDTGGSGGKSVDDIVKEQCLDLLSKMPEDFVEEIFRAQIQKLKGPPNTPDKGFSAPLNIFLFQELQRLQNIIKIVRTNLKSISMAIDGTVVMTTDLLADLGSIFDARVPIRWTNDASGAEISWLMPNLGGWFTGLTDRHQMLNNWLENSRSVMKSYWLTGFTNAQGFLTGMRQEVTRQHKKDQWALDDVISHTEVLPHDEVKIRDVPEEGQNIHGLFIEGGRWDRQLNRLEESEPKKLYVAMPAIYVTATTARDLKAMGINHGPHGPYNSAVYKYPKRNDRYLIFRLLLKTELHPFHWKLRGVCLVAQTE